METFHWLIVRDDNLAWICGFEVEQGGVGLEFLIFFLQMIAILVSIVRGLKVCEKYPSLL